MDKIRIGIVGYGNLGRGAEASVKLQPDMELIGVFSRRKGIKTVSGVPAYTMDEMLNFKGKIDVMILCGGSATDLIEQTPAVAAHFTCIDSFDTHPRITEHFNNLRDCYVVAAEGADKARIENEIKTMKNYFVGYETVVHFISQEELDRDHKGIPHGGFVLRSGESTPGTKHVVEYRLQLDSNPEFTGSVLTAYARGLHRLAKHKATGAFTVFDIPPAWISVHSDEELRAHSL